MIIKNRYINLAYNKFDFLIRFIYCKVPLISKLLFWKIYSSNFTKLDKHFENMKELIHSSNLSLKDKVCLELGPGNSYINAYNLLMNGAKRVILVDKFPRHIKTKKQKRYFENELDYIKKKFNKKRLFFIKNGKIDKRYIRFIVGDFAKIRIDEKINFVLSISVLEHIKNIKEVISKLSEIVEEKGLMYHSIDLRDHYNFDEPFLFYKYSSITWNKYLTKEGISFTNRIRYNEYLNMFKITGFKIMNQSIKKFSLSKVSINKEFQDKEYLNVGILRILMRR